MQHINNGSRKREEREKTGEIVEEWLRILQKLTTHQTTDLGNSENTKYNKCKTKNQYLAISYSNC